MQPRLTESFRSLAVARASWAEAQAGIVTAGARPNPTLSFMPQYVFNPGGEPPWVHTLTLDIPIETGGKRSARIAQATQLSESARLGIAAAAWQVRSQLRIAVILFLFYRTPGHRSRTQRTH